MGEKLTPEQEAYAATIRAELEKRLSALLASSPRVKYTTEGREAIRLGALEAIREVEPAADLFDVSTPEERARGLIRLCRVAPVEAVVTSGVVGPPCHPSMPCGCYGCATCNGAQAPVYGSWGPSTPALGVPVLKNCTFEPKAPTYACNRYNPCGHYDCQKCFPGQILPPDMRGSKKPNGGGSKATKAANAERGYRVLPYADWLNKREGDRQGDTFSTPDLATQRARRGAKEGKETFLVLRDGARWKLLKADGDEVVIG